MSTPKILVTNDDGIDSVGLHKLALALTDLGDVTVVAPDREFSGAGASIGALHLQTPEVIKGSMEGIDKTWVVSGPPALCVVFARMGAFDFRPDLIVSGINPGANVGRSVYYSGTIGACLAGRNGGISGLAVSQGVSSYDVQGQGLVELLANQNWDTAAAIAHDVVGALLKSPPENASVLNLNVPNLELDEIKAWSWTDIYGSKFEHGNPRDRDLGSINLIPKEGQDGRFSVDVNWVQAGHSAEGTDTKAIENDEVSLSWISHLTAPRIEAPVIDGALDAVIG